MIVSQEELEIIRKQLGELSSRNGIVPNYNKEETIKEIEIAVMENDYFSLWERYYSFWGLYKCKK